MPRNLSQLTTRFLVFLAAIPLLMAGFHWLLDVDVEPVWYLVVLAAFSACFLGVFAFSWLSHYLVRVRHTRRHRKLYELGMAAFVKEDYDAARGYFQKFQECPRCDGHWRVDLWIGICLRYQGRPHEAIDAFERAYQANPNPPDATQVLETLLARATQEDVRNEERIAALEQAARQIENDANLRMITIVTWALAELERFDEAIATYEKAMLLMPEGESDK